MNYEENFGAFPNADVRLKRVAAEQRIAENRQRYERARRSGLYRGFGSYGWGWNEIMKNAGFAVPLPAPAPVQGSPSGSKRREIIVQSGLSAAQTDALNAAINDLNTAIGKLNAVRNSINAALGIRGVVN